VSEKLLLDALSEGLALLERQAKATEAVANAISCHQLSLQSVWEMLDAIDTAISQLVEVAERFDTRDDEQFQWRLEARKRSVRPEPQALSRALEIAKAAR